MSYDLVADRGQLARLVLMKVGCSTYCRKPTVGRGMGACATRGSCLFPLREPEEIPTALKTAVYCLVFALQYTQATDVIMPGNGGVGYRQRRNDEASSMQDQRIRGGYFWPYPVQQYRALVVQ